MKETNGIWAILIAVCANTVATIGIGLMVMLWMRAEANADRREFHQVMRELRGDIQDAHVRLGVLEKAK